MIVSMGSWVCDLSFRSMRVFEARVLTDVRGKSDKDDHIAQLATDRTLTRCYDPAANSNDMLNALRARHVNRTVHVRKESFIE